MKIIKKGLNIEKIKNTIENFIELNFVCNLKMRDSRLMVCAFNNFNNIDHIFSLRH